MWIPSDHNRYKENSSLTISSHRVPCKSHWVGGIDGIGGVRGVGGVGGVGVVGGVGGMDREGGVSRNFRNEFHVGCQVCLVI